VRIRRHGAIARHENGRGRSRRHSYAQYEFPIVDFPVADDVTMDRVILTFYESKVADHRRLDDEVLESRGLPVAPDSRQAFGEPRAY
jgi:hypothetical protein